MRFLGLLLLLPLPLAGCAEGRPPPPLRAAAGDDVLLADFEGKAYLLRLPAFRWERTDGETPSPPLMEPEAGPVSHRGDHYLLVVPRDLAQIACAEIRRVAPDGRRHPFLRLQGADVRGMLEAGGFLFVTGDRLWVLNDKTGGMREVPLPFAVRWRRALHGASDRFHACTGGCLEIFGVLFTPAGPDPGWKQLPLP